PKPVQIADNFDDNTFDGTTWYAIRSGTGWADAVRNGRLEFSFSANATPGGDYNRIGGHYGTQCKFPRDFDARGDFTLPTWPSGSGVGVTLWAFLSNRGNGVSRQSSPQWGESYTSWIASDSGGAQLTDTSGSLRLARHNGVMRSFIWHKGAWRKMISN